MPPVDPPSATQPIPAATMIVFRESPRGSPEILMVERAKAMVFAGGALVFPGGRIDPGDAALAALLGLGDDGAAKVAAIRETIEEAGLPVGVVPAPSAPALERLRARLHDGDAFADALVEAGATLDPDVLVPFARWLPAHRQMRIFDTLFFLARLPAGAAPPRVDATENVRLLWTTPADVLADADAGRVTVIYPTRRNLERLARFADLAAAVADARAHPIRTITPWTEMRDGIAHLCIPDDLGYPVTSQALGAAERG